MTWQTKKSHNSHHELPPICCSHPPLTHSGVCVWSLSLFCYVLLSSIGSQWNACAMILSITHTICFITDSEGAALGLSDTWYSGVQIRPSSNEHNLAKHQSKKLVSKIKVRIWIQECSYSTKYHKTGKLASAPLPLCFQWCSFFGTCSRNQWYSTPLFLAPF